MPVRTIIYLLVIVFFTSCLERYWPDVEKYEELLVVDGTLTDQSGPYQVLLSTSSALDRMQFNPVTGAGLTISDNLGNIFPLYENAAGRYETLPDFQAVVGRQYKLMVQTPDGKNYETDYQELKEAPDIDSVYTETEMRDTRSEYETVGGYQFYVDVTENSTDGGYYFWRMEEAYRYRSAFFIEFIYDGIMHEIFTGQDSVYLCYAQGKRSEIVTFDTKNLQEKNIKKLPLVFISNQTPRLSMRYSLLVKQYSISEEAYNYWNGIEKQRGDQGTLYSKQPYQIAGNLKNIVNPQEPVLGFFVVGGVKEKRVFVSRPPGIPVFIFTCTPDEEAIGFLNEIPESEYPVYFFRTGPGGMATASDFCFDCTLRGGRLEKPDFWKD